MQLALGRGLGHEGERARLRQRQKVRGQVAGAAVVGGSRPSGMARSGLLRRRLDAQAVLHLERDSAVEAASGEENRSREKHRNELPKAPMHGRSIAILPQRRVCGHNPAVSRVRSVLAYLMLAVRLATVLAPGYAWEAAAADAHHEDGSGPAEVQCAGESATPVPGGASERSGEEHHGLHGCPGHVLGHLVCAPDAPHQCAARVPHDRAVAGAAADSPSRFPEALDRPPA